MVRNGMKSSYMSVDCIGLWLCLVWLSIFSVPLYLWYSWCFMYFIFFLNVFTF